MKYLKQSNSEKAESRLVVARVWGQREVGSYCSKVIKLPSDKMKNF